MSENKLAYNLIIRAGDQEVVVILGEQPGWIAEHTQILEGADRLTLVPKPGSTMPLVAVRIPRGGHWIYFARTLVKMNTSSGAKAEIIIYALGWKIKERERVRKQITWIYPHGVVEVSENEDRAEFGEQVLNAAAAQVFAKSQQEVESNGSND